MSFEQPLFEILQNEIRASGPMTFHCFMDLCLYHPQHGYYNSGKVSLGKAGDFFTSAHAGPVFARLLARHLYRSWSDAGRPPRFDFTELGAGDGSLAYELLSWTGERFPEMFSSFRYTGVEQGAA